LSSSALLALAYGCSASNDASVDNPANGGSGGLSEAGLAEQVIRSEASSPDDGSLRLNPLCGVEPTCVPDDYTACASYMPPVLAVGGAAGEGGGSGEGGATSVIATGEGMGGNISASLPDDGGASGTAGAGGVPGSGGESAQAGAAGAADIPIPLFGCQVQRASTSPLTPQAQCGLVGLGGGNAPCLTSSDCQAGYGCVGDQSAGLCQRYCCQDADACDTDTYCAERPLRDALINAQGAAVTALTIPVCVPAENCDLSAPYPCPSGKECACKAGTACLVVRADGTTTCAVPGAGTAGDACPCAWDHVCSAATNQCLKLCYTRDTTACDGTQKCQSAAGLPDGWGVCIGG
jgi:hypothetical protein